MATVGMIAEFNPLHSGHKYVMDTVKSRGDTLVCVISGNFVQRGDTAILSKYQRARFALACKADIVAELPVLWSMSTAQNFALGGVSQLYHLGCERIIFGSECADIDLLTSAADVLCSDRFSAEVCEAVKSGITFAVAREEAAKRLGVPEGLLSSPNDNLGIEYIIAARKLGISKLIDFECIKRVGASHDSRETSGEHISASLIRDYIKEGKIGYAERYFPREIRGIINESDISDIKRLDRAILASLRVKTAEDFKRLPDVGEGLENKLFFAVKNATTFDELCASVKTKRYTMARIRRIILSAFLGTDGKFFMTPPPYVRLLGFSQSGAEHIKGLSSLIPIVSKVSEIKELDDRSKEVFDTECRATDIYNLSFEPARECSTEYKMKFIVAK